MRLEHTTISLLLGLVAALGGCATIVSGTEQKIPVTSEPLGATVMVDGSGSFTTPVDLRLARRENHTLLVSKPGYHTSRVELRKEMNGMLLGNILLGGIVGGVADVASGAAARLVPETVHVALEPCGYGEATLVRDWNPPKESRPTENQDGGTGETYSPSRSNP